MTFSKISRSFLITLITSSLCFPELTALCTALIYLNLFYFFVTNVHTCHFSLAPLTFISMLFVSAVYLLYLLQVSIFVNTLYKAHSSHIHLFLLSFQSSFSQLLLRGAPFLSTWLILFFGR